MKLSVIVPAYNAAHCLRTCLDSLACQNLEDWEVIIVDDGSADETPQIIREYESRYPQLFRSITLENGGQGRARNIALASAKGEYIGFADSDDTVSPDMFPKMLKKAYAEQADLVICDFLRIDNFGEHYEPARMQNHPLAATGPVWNKLFRSSLIGDTRFSEGLWYEDFCFSAEMLIKSRKTVYIPEPLYRYICGHSSTMFNTNSRKNLDILRVFDELKEFLQQKGLEADLDFLAINHILLEAIKRVNAQDTPEKDEVIAQLRDYVRHQIPSLHSCSAFRSETRNRRIIMWMNYHGMEKFAGRILKIR